MRRQWRRVMEHWRKARRVFRCASYSTLVVAGVALIVQPTASLRSALGFVVYLWAVFLMVGSLASLLGAATGRWIGEYAGLPLAASTMGVYSAIILFSDDFTWVKLALGMIFLGFGLKMMARWDDIRKLVAASKKAAEQGTRDEEE